MQWQRRKILVVVKANPNPSTKYVETVCTAGVLVDKTPHQWVRIFPVPFRFLDGPKQFRKYDFIEANLSKAGDVRKESHKVNADTIKVVGKAGTGRGWLERRSILVPLAVSSMCEIDRLAKEKGVSLGMFRPARPVKLTWERRKKVISAGARAGYEQLSMLHEQKNIIEPVPYVFRYEYRCEGEPACRGHKQAIIDWEIGTAFFKWRRSYGSDDKTLAAIKTKWEGEMFAAGREAFLMVGDQQRFRGQFMVLGTFWPPRPTGQGEFSFSSR